MELQPFASTPNLIAFLSASGATEQHATVQPPNLARMFFDLENTLSKNFTFSTEEIKGWTHCLDPKTNFVTHNKLKGVQTLQHFLDDSCDVHRCLWVKVKPKRKATTASPRKPSTKPAVKKSAAANTVQSVRTLYSEFLTGTVDAETYLDGLVKFLGFKYQGRLDTEIRDFLGLHTDELADGSFAKKSAFARTLRETWEQYRLDEEIADPMRLSIKNWVDEEEPRLGLDAYEYPDYSKPYKPKKTLNHVKYEQSKESVIQAYTDVVANPDGPEAQKNFFDRIIPVALGFLGKELWKKQEVAELPDDFANKTALKIWDELPDFVPNRASAKYTSDGDAFYAWLCSICARDARHAAMEIDEHLDVFKDKLYFIGEDGEVVDNPILNRTDGFREHERELPEFIQGKDRLICDLIRAGMNYEEIGEYLGISEAAVNSRIQRMRTKIEEEKKESSK
jgi:hypothetical protein